MGHFIIGYAFTVPGNKFMHPGVSFSMEDEVIDMFRSNTNVVSAVSSSQSLLNFTSQLHKYLTHIPTRVVLIGVIGHTDLESKS